MIALLLFAALLGDLPAAIFALAVLFKCPGSSPARPSQCRVQMAWSEFRGQAATLPTSSESVIRIAVIDNLLRRATDETTVIRWSCHAAPSTL